MTTTAEAVVHPEQVLTEHEKNRQDKPPVSAKDTKAISAEDINALLKSVQSDEQGNFQKIIITQDIFKKIKESLLVTIQSMEKNPSLLSRAAEFWGELPLWQKILGGVALTVPTLILGIIAHLGFMLTICGVTTVVYAGGGLILDDHHSCNTSVTESLAKGIIGLADLLELTISALDAIRQKLAEEVAKFTAENDRLKEHVNCLSSKIQSLGIEITAAAELALALKTTKDELEKTTQNLKDQIGAQSDLFLSTQQELQKVTDAYNANQQLLAEKINDFSETEKKLQDDLKKARMLADYLGTVVNQFSKTILNEEQQKEEFTKRLNEFLHNGEASFSALAERWSIAEEKLMVTEQKLTETEKNLAALSVTYEEIINKFKLQLTRLVSISDQKEQRLLGLSTRLDNMGFFAPGMDKTALISELKTICELNVPAEEKARKEEQQTTPSLA